MTKQELIDEIMNNFNFEKVHKTMTLLDWKWYQPDFKSEVPNLEKIKVLAISHLKGALSNPKVRGVSISYGGGFQADYDHKEGILSLKFVVDSWEADKDDELELEE